MFTCSHNHFYPGYHTPDTTPEDNTITFEVAITMLDHVFNESYPYTVGFTVWKKAQDSVEIMWSAQEEVQAYTETLASLVGAEYQL